jgi:amino acid adenylation domain-containing protein
MPSTAVDRADVEAHDEDDLVFPLSFAQRRLWFLNQLEPDNTFYNLPLAIPLAMPVNAAVLERSVGAIVERHETLRTVFRIRDGEPVQIVRPAAAVPLVVVDLRPRSKEEQSAETTRLTAELARRPFDLSQGPLLRIALLQRGAQDNVFVLVMHHIISDGWSLGVFWHELIALYNGVFVGQPKPLPDLPIQYADFAVWQRERLQGERLAELTAYWRRQLDGLPSLNLPTDRPRPPVLAYRGAFEPLALPPALVGALRALSQREGATLFMTLFAAFAILLRRYCGQDDIVVGLPTASRDHTELEGLIGFFINSLVLRVDLSGDPSFRALLALVRETALDAYAHQELPFEKLVEDLQPARDLGRNPLFQVTFQLFSPHKEAQQASAERTPMIVINRGSAVFDLAVNLWEAPDEVGGQVEYSTDLFDASTIARLIGHYRTLLRSILTNPDARLSELPLLTEAERRQMLREWNATGSTVPPVCVQAQVEQQAKRQPDAVAISAGAESLTYGELNRRANQLARRLRDLGVGRDALVGVCAERGVRMAVGLLAVLKAGGAYVPVDPSYPPDRIAFMLKDSEAKVVVSERAVAAVLPPQDAPVLLLDDADPGEPDEGNPDHGPTPDDLCYVVYTSGSTGNPKGVAIPHRGLTNLVAWHRAAFAVSSADRASQVASLGFDACGWELWPYLAAGASVHIIPNAVRASPPDLLRALAEARITIAFLPTPLAQMVFDEPALGELPLRYLLTGGDKLTRGPPPDCPFTTVNNYGPTEYSVVATSCEIGSGREPQPIGRPIANTDVYVLDRDLQPVPVGVTGELYVGGAGLARGYHNRPELTAERFVDNPVRGTGCPRLYRTGDLVRYRADGLLDFVGRADNQIKIRGLRIELGEIEAAMNDHPDVADAVVTLAPSDGDRLVAYVVPRHSPMPGGNGADAARESFIEMLRNSLCTKLPAYMVPAHFVLLRGLPQTPNGKIDRQALPSPDAARVDDGRIHAEPRTPLEEVLVGMWAEVLELDQIGINDSFFELGGHSLVAARLISRVRDRLKVEVPLQTLFRSPTPAQFAASLMAGADSPAALTDMAKLLTSVSRLSDAEVKQMLGLSAAFADEEARS